MLLTFHLEEPEAHILALSTQQGPGSLSPSVATGPGRLCERCLLALSLAIKQRLP